MADRLVKVTDEQNNETSISYDLAGRKISMDDPDMGHWSYAYDALGNLTRQTDARQERICFFYDDLNRITGKQYRSDDNCSLASGLDVTYLYDQGVNGKGRRTGMQDPSGESSWQYDQKGRLIEESKTITDNGQPFIFRSQWSYDASDRVHTMTYPADEQGNLGETVTYQYSQDEYKTRAQVEGLVSDLGTYISGMQYNVYGQRTEATLGTSEPVTQEFSYYALDELHGLGRLRRIRSRKSDNTLIQRLRYTYDAVGNVQSIRNRLQNEVQNEQFSYDHLDRLLTAEAADGDNGLYSTAYSYDKIGNLTNKGGTDYTYGTQQAYCTAGALNKPHAVVNQGGWDYCYDANGNMTDKVVFIYATNYTYDSENRLTDVSANGASIANYTYDGDGNRVKVAESSQTTLYVGSLVQWRNGTLIKYYEVGGSRVAMREGDTLSFILANQLTSTTVTLDSSGNVQSELRYHPFGQTRHSDGTTPTNRRFTGQIEDQGTGLYYYNARYYNPELGRFIQADTIVPEPGNPQALNRYSYVYNNPLRYTDPSGHCPAPPPDSGNVICVSAFIPTETSTFVPGVYEFRGDNRDFSSDSPQDASRFWVWIDADTGEAIESYVHPTCDLTRCFEPIDWYNEIETTMTDDGTITLTYNVVCSHPFCLAAPGPEGTMTFTPDGNGGYKTAGNAEPFPNLEAYHWRDGELQNNYLFRIQNFSQEELQVGRSNFGTGLGMMGGLYRIEWESAPSSHNLTVIRRYEVY